MTGHGGQRGLSICEFAIAHQRSRIKYEIAVDVSRIEFLGLQRRIEWSDLESAGGCLLLDTGGYGDDEVEMHWLELRVRMGAMVELFVELRLAVTVADAGAALGVTDRGELSRELARRRLPPFRLLKNWFQVVEMANHSEGGTSLCNLALSRGEYPAGKRTDFPCFHEVVG